MWAYFNFQIIFNQNYFIFKTYLINNDKFLDVKFNKTNFFHKPLFRL